MLIGGASESWDYLTVVLLSRVIIISIVVGIW